MQRSHSSCSLSEMPPRSHIGPAAGGRRERPQLEEELAGVDLGAGARGPAAAITCVLDLSLSGLDLECEARVWHIEEAAIALDTRMGRRVKEAEEGALVSAAVEEPVGFHEVLFQVWYIVATNFMIQRLRERGLDLGSI